MAVKKISVLGVGTIGYQIAQQAAQSGYQVSWRDVDQKFLDEGLAKIKQGLERFFVAKGRMTQQEADAALGRISMTTDLKQAVSGVDLVIEAIPERMDLKKQVFKELDELCAPATILASNTSSLSITEIGSLTKRQDKVVGMHFFFPVAVMRLIEIVRGANTSEETLTVIKDLAKSFGKETVVLNDSPGFITSRMIIVMINEAAKMVHEGVATAEEVDRAIELGLNHPMGPLKIADTNLEISLNGLNYFRQELGEAYRPCPLIKKMCNAGQLGVKTGRGFYTYKKK